MMRLRGRKVVKALGVVAFIFLVHVCLSSVRDFRAADEQSLVALSDSETEEQAARSVRRSARLRERRTRDLDRQGQGSLAQEAIDANDISNHAPNRRISEIRDSAPRHRDRKLGSSVHVEGAHLQTELEDIFISVKTTKKYHSERVDLLLRTWVMFAQDSTYFFTDEDDDQLKAQTRNHVINTNCSAAHTRQALCCKMSVEYDTFIASGKRWFCHVDDDTYVSTGALVRLLRKYNHTQDHYLGKPSINHPLQIQKKNHPQQKIAFWFATGGAGFCISRGLALKMMPHTSGGRLKTVCEQIRLPDDCTVGYIISHILKKDLTVVSGFHSHLEGLWKINHMNIENQITVSYMCSDDANDKKSCNAVDLAQGFSQERDPTRFLSIHCLLYPNLQMCKS